MSAATFGLDIGQNSISLAKVGGSQDSLFLESIAVAPAPAPGILSESTIELEKVADVIRNMMEESDLDTKLVNVSLPESQVYAKIIQMPKLSERELSAALAYEMDQYIPLPLDQVRTDWQILSETQKQSETLLDILIVASSLSVIEKYNKILNFSSLKLTALETEMISVRRALMPLLSQSAASMIIHISPSTTDIAVLRGGTLSILHTIGLGGLAISRGLSADLGIDVADINSLHQRAKEVIHGGTGKAITSILDSITGEVRKVMLSYRNKFSVDDISQILLSGEHANIPGLNTFFTQRLSKEVVVPNSWEVNGISNVPEQLHGISPRNNVVLGLALRSLL